jgi:hypothetical protein
MLHRMTSSIPILQCAFNFFINGILIRYGCSQIFELNKVISVPTKHLNAAFNESHVFVHWYDYMDSEYVTYRDNEVRLRGNWTLTHKWLRVKTLRSVDLTARTIFVSFTRFINAH